MKPIYDYNLVVELADGVRSSSDIAKILDWPAKRVQGILLKLDLPRLKANAQTGEKNPSFLTGRKIDAGGYAHVRAPIDHPYQKRRKDRNYGTHLEHRLILEKHLGRYLERSEVVDHIDGLTLHNDINNLRLFASNGEHLKHTLAGRCPQWSREGLESLQLRNSGKGRKLVDTYNLRKGKGDVRLLQILRAWLKLGKDSPYLLGTHQWLERSEIDYSCGRKIELAYLDLCKKWELVPDL